ncbi:CAP domain-containing protein [Carnobacterium funditum]|uniref:CAP domain-containing protein n=1 Tax=Carnobacterium funditum TaxID=2752 RepID=UPI00054EFF38|nr:CAP domain-containing protein [Carnobacterium funditum]
MKRLFSSILLVTIALILGFWLGKTNALQGTWIGDTLSDTVEKIPNPESIVTIIEGEGSLKKVTPIPESQPQESTAVSEPEKEINETTANIDYKLIEDTIFNLLNQVRRENNLPELTPNAQLKKAARKRAKETEESFSHTRPDGSETFTILEEADYKYVYQLAGENLGMATNYLDETGMAELLSNGWVDSPGHYENMIRKEFKEVGIGVSFDGENIYAVQLFGTPMAN